MLSHQDRSYQYKDEIIRTSLQLIIHEALRLSKPIQFDKKANASERLTTFFLDLLEWQFPIESPEQRLLVKTPTDFAKRLAVHTNYLNRSVKTITGKTTTTHITNRIIMEAKALIKFSDWDISEIAYALGFEYTTHFNNYFRRETGLTPKSLRTIVWFIYWFVWQVFVQRFLLNYLCRGIVWVIMYLDSLSHLHSISTYIYIKSNYLWNIQC